MFLMDLNFPIFTRIKRHRAFLVRPARQELRADIIKAGQFHSICTGAKTERHKETGLAIDAFPIRASISKPVLLLCFAILCLLAAFLVGHGAAGLAGRLAGSLALAACAGFAEGGFLNGANVFHGFLLQCMPQDANCILPNQYSTDATKSQGRIRLGNSQYALAETIPGQARCLPSSPVCHSRANFSPIFSTGIQYFPQSFHILAVFPCYDVNIEREKKNETYESQKGKGNRRRKDSKKRSALSKDCRADSGCDSGTRGKRNAFGSKTVDRRHTAPGALAFKDHAARADAMISQLLPPYLFIHSIHRNEGLPIPLADLRCIVG